MPLEERYVIWKRRRIMDAGQSEAQRIAHRCFKPLKSFNLSRHRLVDQMHCIIDKHACSECPKSGKNSGRRERKKIRTSGIPGLVTYDETPIDLVWNIVKFREDCIRDPICMTVDAHEQDTATTKKRFTLKVILWRRRTQTNERQKESLAKVAAHTAEGNSPPGQFVWFHPMPMIQRD